jgi:hypothetical protein
MSFTSRFNQSSTLTVFRILPYKKIGGSVEGLAKVAGRITQARVGNLCLNFPNPDLSQMKIAGIVPKTTATARAAKNK